MPRYAKGTHVSTDRTITQIRSLLLKFGADHFALGEAPGRSTVGFRFHGRTVRFDLVTPDLKEERFTTTPSGRLRNGDAQLKEWEAARREQWRMLLLLLKALLYAIEAGFLDFDRAFFHDIVTPDGRTVGEKLLPQVQAMIEKGSVGPLLLENPRDR